MRLTQLILPKTLSNEAQRQCHTLLSMWLLIHAGIKVKPC